MKETKFQLLKKWKEKSTWVTILTEEISTSAYRSHEVNPVPYRSLFNSADILAHFCNALPTKSSSSTANSSSSNSSSLDLHHKPPPNPHRSLTLPPSPPHLINHESKATIPHWCLVVSSSSVSKLKCSVTSTQSSSLLMLLKEFWRGFVKAKDSIEEREESIRVCHLAWIGKGERPWRSG